MTCFYMMILTSMVKFTWGSGVGEFKEIVEIQIRVSRKFRTGVIAMVVVRHRI